MTISTGSTIVSSDFVSTSAGAGDSGKVPKLGATGKLDVSVMPISPVVRTYLVGVSPATWTKPAGLKYITVEVQAGGGSSGGTNSNTNQSTGGAGAGGYSRKTIAAATLGATETVTIGAGGTAPGTDTDGNDGGSSSFGAHATASGGGKSLKENSGGGGGGVGASGDVNLSGESGWSGIGVVATMQSGPGGKSLFGVTYGKGADGVVSHSSATAGNAGVAGFVVVTEYYV
jgi:hypothetical protein